MSDLEREDPPLDDESRARVRRALGAPTPGRAAGAIEEVERQVAMEDLVLLMVDGAAGAARAFLDSIVSLADAEDAPAGATPKERSDERMG